MNKKKFLSVIMTLMIIVTVFCVNAKVLAVEGEAPGDNARTVEGQEEEPIDTPEGGEENARNI